MCTITSLVNTDFKQFVSPILQEMIEIKSELSSVQEKYYTTCVSSQDIIDHLTADLNRERARAQKLVNDLHNTTRKYEDEKEAEVQAGGQ